MNSEDGSARNTDRQANPGKFDSSSDLPEIRDVVSVDGDGNEAIDPPGPGADVDPQSIPGGPKPGSGAGKLIKRTAQEEYEVTHPDELNLSQIPDFQPDVISRDENGQPYFAPAVRNRTEG
jgi:hypothetical protein